MEVKEVHIRVVVLSIAKVPRVPRALTVNYLKVSK